MVKTVRRIRFALSVSLVLAIIIHAVIFTSGNRNTEDVRGKSFELFRDQQKDTGHIQPQPIDNTETPTRLVVGSDLGEPQIIHKMAAKVIQRVEKARKHIHETVMVEPRYEKVRGLCRNHNARCAFWAEQGQCYKNMSGYMKKHCAPVCFSCNELHREAKCPIDPNVKNAWSPGDLNLMFERLTTDSSFEQYTPKVLSRPNFVGNDTIETADYQLGPWVLLMEDLCLPRRPSE